VCETNATALSEVGVFIAYEGIMTENNPDRQLTIRSRVADGYRFSQNNLKDLQHVLTDWIPRAVYHDLTGDTVRVDVVVRKEYTSERTMFTTSFIRADGSLIKTVEYSEERVVGKACEYFNPKKSHYEGNKDGYDQRLVYYTAAPKTK
jgi:hypothetical protein